MMWAASPLQMVVSGVMMFIVARFTVTFSVLESGVQPDNGNTAFTVYDVLTTGVAMGCSAVALLRVAAGVHVYTSPAEPLVRI
jgi:hypothetical protein